LGDYGFGTDTGYLPRGAEARTAGAQFVEGDPLDLIHNVLNVKVTIKGGVVVHDARKR